MSLMQLQKVQALEKLEMAKFLSLPSIKLSELEQARLIKTQFEII
jgi:hypothetical protein